MHDVSPTHVVNWSNDAGTRLPAGVSLPCPHCGLVGTFIVGAKRSHSTNGAPLRSTCPSCRERVRFWMTAPPSEERSGWLWIHPDPKMRPLMDDVLALDELSDGLKRSYQDAVKAFNAGLWGPSAVAARRTLEGIAKILHPEPGRKTLATLLRQLPDHVKLDKPIREVADVVREGANLAAHFDLDRDTFDDDTAQALLQLLEDLIEYLFLLPLNVEEARQRIQPPVEISGDGPGAGG